MIVEWMGESWVLLEQHQIFDDLFTLTLTLIDFAPAAVRAIGLPVR